MPTSASPTFSPSSRRRGARLDRSRPAGRNRDITYACRAVGISCCSVPRRIVMIRRSIFTLGAMAALGLALLPSDLTAQQRSLKDQLVGTWTIVSWESIAPNGTKRQITNPNGFLIFDSGGRYAQV